MTNKEIQEKVLERLQSVLGITASEYYNKPHPKIFGKISKRAAYHVAIGQFDSKYVGELGLIKLEKHRELENDKENGTING
jgi:hypothetical protein